MRLSDVQVSLEKWLATNGGTLGVADGALECETSEGDRFTCKMSRTGKPVVEAVVPTGNLDGSERESLLQKVLEWNCARLKEQAETLAYDEGADVLVLFRTLSQDCLSPGRLTVVLESFIESARFWIYALSQDSGSSGGLLGGSRF